MCGLQGMRQRRPRTRSRPWSELHALGPNVFDHGQKAAADQMQTSMEKITKCVGTARGQDISNELQNKIAVVIAELMHAPATLSRHAAPEAVIRAGQARIETARLAQETTLLALVGTPEDDPVQLATLQNEIPEGQHESSQPTPMQLADSGKTQNSNDWRTHRERNASLAKH